MNLCPLDPYSTGFSTPALIGRHEHEAEGGVEGVGARVEHRHVGQMPAHGELQYARMACKEASSLAIFD